MRITNHARNEAIRIGTILLLIGLVGGCGRTPTESSLVYPRRSPGGAPTFTPQPESGFEGTTPLLPSDSNLGPDVAVYYDAVIFVEGATLRLKELDLGDVFNSGNPAVLMPLFSLPGMVEDHILKAQASPVPDGLEAAWAKTLEVSERLSTGLEQILMVMAAEGFQSELGVLGELASEAVAEVEAVLVSQYGVTQADLASARQSPLAELEEVYQAFGSMMLLGQAQGDDGSE